MQLHTAKTRGHFIVRWQRADPKSAYKQILPIDSRSSGESEGREEIQRCKSAPFQDDPSAPSSRNGFHFLKFSSLGYLL